MYVHIEAPDEMGHQGSTEHKIEAIQYIDENVIGPVTDALSQAGVDYRMLVMPDHPTPVRVRTHTSDPVPYMIYDSTAPVEGKETYCERTGKETGGVSGRKDTDCWITCWGAKSEFGLTLWIGWTVRELRNRDCRSVFKGKGPLSFAPLHGVRKTKKSDK